MTEFFQPGQHIVIREVAHGHVWTRRPVTVVHDKSDLIVFWMKPGTLYKHPRTLDGSRVPDTFVWPWKLVDREWTGGDCAPDGWTTPRLPLEWNRIDE